MAKSGLTVAKTLQGSDVDRGYRKKTRSRNQDRLRRIIG